MERNGKTKLFMMNVKANIFLRLMALCMFGLVLTVEAVAQSAYTDGKAAQLNASRIKKLKSLRTPIAVPIYVPAGYRLKDAERYVERSGGFWSVDYTLTYKNAKGDVFQIISSNEGPGDFPIYTVLTGKNPFFFGGFSVRTEDVTDDGKVKANARYETDWVENKPAYVPKGARSRSQSYRVDSTALSPKEVLKVMMSLRYLR